MSPMAPQAQVWHDGARMRVVHIGASSTKVRVAVVQFIILSIVRSAVAKPSFAVRPAPLACPYRVPTDIRSGLGAANARRARRYQVGPICAADPARAWRPRDTRSSVFRLPPPSVLHKWVTTVRA